MRTLQEIAKQDRKTAEPTETARPEVLPLIVSARTALTEPDDALLRRIPSNYRDSTVSEVLGYIVETEAKGNEAQALSSLKKELGSAGSVVVINGKGAKLTDKISKYVVNKEHKNGERNLAYQALEIEVSAVEQGGFYR